MRILFLTNNDNGLYRFRKELLQHLAARHEVWAALPFGEFIPAIEETGCRCIDWALNSRGMNPLKDLGVFRFALRLMKKLKPDVVVFFTIKPNVYGGLCARLLGLPYIGVITGLGTAIEDGGLLSRLVLRMYRTGLRRASCVLFENESNRRFLLDKKVVSGKSRCVSGAGVNLQEQTFTAYPPAEAPLRLLFIGRIMKNKGVDELFKASENLVRRFPGIRIELMGEMDEDYAAKVQALENQGILHYLGFRNDVHEQIMASHCVVLPSYHEGMANVLLESAAAGRPIIATRVPGCMEAFDEGISGLGCDPRSASDLERAMAAFILLPHKQKVQMGLEGHQKMVREFDRTRVVEAYTEEIMIAARENRRNHG